MPMHFVLRALLLIFLTSAAESQVSRLERWFPVQDPPHAGLSASRTGSGSATRVVLTASNVAIPSGTDIGYKSFNGNTANDSSAGYAFNPASDFNVAVDYEITFTGGNALNLGIGFGVGEDANGVDSLGVALVRAQVSIIPGFPITLIGIGATARVDDITQPLTQLGIAANNSSDAGSFFVNYTAATGTIVVGRSASPGANAPTLTKVFASLQNQWNDRDLIVSFFMRSEGWTGGTAVATFSNLRLLNGVAISVPPKIKSIDHQSGSLNFEFEGGSGWDYFIQGGANLMSFPEDLTDAPATILSELPVGSGIFTGRVDVSAKGSAYFIRIIDQDPTP